MMTKCSNVFASVWLKCWSFNEQFSRGLSDQWPFNNNPWPLIRGFKGPFGNYQWPLVREGLIKKNLGIFQMGGGDPIPDFFLRREILKSVYDGLIHPEN